MYALVPSGLTAMPVLWQEHPPVCKNILPATVLVAVSIIKT
jgi:hypothetical protein